jgi:hypothetical protein
MPTINDLRIEELAESCVNDLGDIFWDSALARHTIGQHSDLQQAAIESVKRALNGLVEQMDSGIIYPASLRAEYKAVIAHLPGSPSDRDVSNALIRESAWTERGSREVVRLARQYGFAILRNALALAEALDIEDGEAGL